MSQTAEAWAKPFIGAVGLYRLYDAADRLLYVGIGPSPETRWAVHAKTDWWPQVARKHVEWFHVYAAARRAEIQAIWDEKPIHNTERINPAELPEVCDDLESDELPLGDLRSNMTEVLSRVHLLRQVFTITSRGKHLSVVVPIELGRLVRRAGGADRAAEILCEHLGPEPGDDDA